LIAPLKWAVRASDRTSPVRDAAIVAGRFHAIIGAQTHRIAGQIPARAFVEIVERCRISFVAAMLTLNPAQRPHGFLQVTFDNRDKSFKHDMRMFKAAIGKAEVIEAMIQRQASDRDGSGDQDRPSP
jgi:hypothetical protein